MRTGVAGGFYGWPTGSTTNASPPAVSQGISALLRRLPPVNGRSPTPVSPVRSGSNERPARPGPEVLHRPAANQFDRDLEPRSGRPRCLARCWSSSPGVPLPPPGKGRPPKRALAELLSWSGR